MNNTLDAAAQREPFFRRIDWAAFWTATGISFLVYFFTLAPTVTLEDSGELATAGAHWGVPHPPGYPIWAFCANLFTWAFQWVTFRGQPTPAWSIALMSGVFGALATGLTAMLITRSSSDVLHVTRQEFHQSEGGRQDLICWAGGVAGSLVFAFSPVMWSQATIVEAYSLNAFFLMWVFLLTYRWMRRPSDKILWLTAFVFGLGLTNYQVLLLAALPLVVVILLRDAALFRDFLLLAIPFGLTMLDLKRGAMPPATPGFFKHQPMLTVQDAPSMSVFVSGLVVFMLAVAAALVLDWLAQRREGVRRFKLPVVAVMMGLALVTMLMAQGFTHRAAYDAMNAPLVHPSRYLLIATIMLGVVACSVVGALAWRGKWSDPWVSGPVITAGCLLLLLWAQLARLPDAAHPPLQPGVVPYSWTLPTLAFFGACALIFVLLWRSPRGLFFALAVLAVQAASFGLTRKGAMLGLTHPTTWWFWAPAAWNFLVLALAWLMLPHGRTTVLSLLAAELGVSFYIYMPIVSDLNNPPMNWGYPRTWEGFKHALTRGQYEKIAPTDIFTQRFVDQVGSYFKDLRVQFTLLVAPLGFLPFAAWQFRAGRRPIRAIYVALALFLISCVFVVIGWHSRLDEAWRFDKVLIAAIMLLMTVGIAAMALNQIEGVCVRTWRSRNWSEILTIGSVLAVVAAGVCGFSARGVAGGLWGADLKSPHGMKMLALAFILSALVLAVLLAVALIAKRVAASVFGFRVGVDDIMQQWLIATVGGFLVMSVLLIVLANPKGDLQDTFIQKVKFVSSHALFAIWIGYGLVFALEMFETTAAGWLRPEGETGAPGKLMTALRAAGIAAVLAVSAIPIYENYTNERLIFEFGAAEQNGHDFGWQFGNSQLRGAEAIREELEPDEEPIPNPLYPPEMGPNAVFFGGTDPGRFVPTYMIYCADVRPDVFLITQNALADNTYMSVMRDLYGDRIYIPTPDDSGRAFQVYVQEVESGKRPRNAELVVENGRVQVSGALGVMEINGILCDMIFRNNKARHNFYVEESYVIGWMFPFMVPHGLIMQIRSDPGPIPPANIRDDMDFWDWYVRRLTADRNFRRDVVAQKSFSKLRSAIAGLYANTGLRAEAEQAFQEARVLYPVSPEANFRLIQEVLLGQGRFDEALDIIKKYNSEDPNNDRGRGFSDWITHLRDTNAKVRDLMSRATPDGRMDPRIAYEIGLCYRDLGNADVAARYIEPIATLPGVPVDLMYAVGAALSALKRHESAVKAMDQVMEHLPPAMPPQQLLEIVRIYEGARRPDRMIHPLSRYLQMRPADWRAWLDLATLHTLNKQPSQAQAAMRRALDLGRDEAVQTCRGNEMLRSLMTQVLQTRAGGEREPPLVPFMRP